MEVFKAAEPRKSMLPWRKLALVATAGLLGLITVVAVIFQDNITRYRLNPRIPYQTYTPPPPPSYGARGAWAVWPDDPKSGVSDVFYVHSTTYASGKHWNGPINDPSADALLRRVAAPNEAGPFMKVGAVYGPRYRQATLFAAFTHKFDGLAARRLAQRDIEAAFRVFLMNRQPNRPFVLVGYGEGGLHVLGLLQNVIAPDPSLRRQLAVAYVIGQPTALSLFDDSLKEIPPCRSPTEIGCVVSYIDLEDGFEAEKKRFQRSLVWSKTGDLISETRAPLLCVNPLSWSVTSELAPPKLHIGAASATGLRMGELPPAIPGATSAQCVKGILTVDSPRQVFLRRRHWFGDQWLPQDFNLFYHDLAADADRRVQLFAAKHMSEPALGINLVDPNSEPANNIRD
jgi:DUF3089 family protein